MLFKASKRMSFACSDKFIGIIVFARILKRSNLHILMIWYIVQTVKFSILLHWCSCLYFASLPPFEFIKVRITTGNKLQCSELDNYALILRIVHAPGYDFKRSLICLNFIMEIGCVFALWYWIRDFTYINASIAFTCGHAFSGKS